MKKIALTVIAISMLLSNMAFASTTKTKGHIQKNTSNVFHLQTQDPGGW